jgi:hypothetical protein
VTRPNSSSTARAELMVENWNRDEPDRAGELHVAAVELEISVN